MSAHYIELMDGPGVTSATCRCGWNFSSSDRSERLEHIYKHLAGIAHQQRMEDK